MSAFIFSYSQYQYNTKPHIDNHICCHLTNHSFDQSSSLPSTSNPHHVIMGGGSATMAQWKTSVLPSSSWKIMIMVMLLIQMWSAQGISMMYDHRDFMEWTRKMFVLVNDCDGCKCDRRCDWWCDYRWEISLRTKLCKQRVEISFCLEEWIFIRINYGMVWFDAMITMKLITKMMKAMEDGRLVAYF